MEPCICSLRVEESVQAGVRDLYQFSEDPAAIKKPDPDPYQREKSNPDPHQSESPYPDPDSDADPQRCTVLGTPTLWLYRQNLFNNLPVLL